MLYRFIIQHTTYDHGAGHEGAAVRQEADDLRDLDTHTYYMFVYVNINIYI